MATFTWDTVGSAVSLLSTELNSLASGAGSAAGPEIDNSSAATQLATLWLHLASNSLAFVASSFVSIYFVQSTTPNASSGVYPTYTSGGSYKLAVGNYWAGDIFINPATQSANVVDETLPFILLPAGYFKTILVDNAGVTLPASGNTLKFYPTPNKVA